MQENVPGSALAEATHGPHHRVLIIDFGSQVTQLIARRVRDAGVYSEVVPFQKAEAALQQALPDAVILSGGPESVGSDTSPRAPDTVFTSGVPVLGICYGQMAMAHQLGGGVDRGDHREYGRAEVKIKTDCALFADLWHPGQAYPVWMSHGDAITRLPQGFTAVAASESALGSGNATVSVMVAAYVAATAVSTELALRGWIVERVLELSPGPPVLPVLVGAIAEALVTPGDLAARLGGGLFGIGLGWMYVAGGRSVLAPVCARLVFELGVVALEALRLIG